MLRSVSASLLRFQNVLRVSHSLQSFRYQSVPSVGLPFLPARTLSVTPSARAESNENIDRSLLRLDNEIRRTGRIAREEIDDILTDIRDMKKATSSQSLMIIRCCGELLPSETAETRTRMVQEVWKTMQNLNVPMDISHYNALLRVYLENEHKFNPTEFLQELTSKGIEPNRVTYQRLIARFCQDGDIDGASTILQHMKEKQLPINEHVFNALVKGHAQADDMESAEGIITVMKQAGLEPNDDTFVTLMCGYAKKGDLENIRRIAADCSAKEVHLIDRDFLNVIYVLAVNDHENLIDDIIPFLKKHTGFNQDATNFVLRLVNAGKNDVAYRLLKEMSRIVRNDELLPSGNFFIQQLVKSDTPSEEIVGYCNRMLKEEINKYALSKACDVALQFQKFEKASDLLEALKESGFPIRQHYFWPFFASSQVEKDIYDGLKSMKYLGLTPSNETLRDYVIPSLFKHSKGMPAEKTLLKLSNYTGIPLNALVPAAMQHLLLHEKDLTEATRFAGKYRLNFTNPQLRRAVLDSYFREKNAALFVQIVGSSCLDGEDQGREAVGIMIMELLESCRPKEKSRWLRPILNELLAHGIGLSNSGAELVQNSLADELTPELANIIMQLTSGELTPKLDMYEIQSQRPGSISMEEKSIPELENLLEEAIKANQPTRSLKKALLFTYCRKRELEKAESIIQEFNAEGFVYPTGLQALILDLYSSQNKIEEARKMYKSLISAIDSPIDDLKILRYAHALISNDYIEEGMDVLKTCPRDDARKAAGAQQQTVVWKILNHFAEKGQVKETQELAHVMRERNLLHLNNVTLGPLVKAHLVKDDLEGALAEFERCVKEHHATPWKQELFCRFIKAEDTERLQKVIDLSTTLHGEVNSMYDLVFAFIQCGKLRQAKKILETPGLRARNDKIELTCQKYLQEDRVEELENLIQITKEVMNIDRNSMYFYLLQSYCKSGDADKALSVWTSLQEENINPSADLLTFLADFLRKNDKPVPFVVPEISEVEVSQAIRKSAPSADNRNAAETRTTSSLIRKFRESIESNDVDTALQLKQRLEGGNTNERLSLQDLSNLIEKMARAERLGEAVRLTEDMMERGSHPYSKCLRLLLGRLANSGNIDVLTRFDTLLSPELKRLTLFNTRLCVAYTNAGKGKDYFESYIRKSVESLSESDAPSEALTVPLSGSTYVLTRHEELLPDFEKLALVAEKKGNINLFNSLWNFHLIKKNFPKAKEIWEDKLKNNSRVLFRSVIVESKLRNDEAIAKELAIQLASAENLSEFAKCSASSSVIDILCSQEKPDEALQYLESCLKANNKLESFVHNSLTLLKGKLEASNKSFPYEIPVRQDRRPRRNVTADDDVE